MQELVVEEGATRGSADRTFYDAETHYFDAPEFARRHLPVVEAYMSTYRSTLADLAKGGRKLRMLELGAGTCMTSLLLSREPWVESMHCIDISASRMKAFATTAAKRVGGRVELLTFGEADFSCPLPLADGVFDVVLFDAALHHSRNMWLTLRECYRVIAPGGRLIAQREQYVGRWTSRLALARLLRSREVRSGVAENAYLREQYEYYLRATGFRPTFIPVASGKLRWISFLNGLVFSKWTIVAERWPEAPVLE